MQLNEGLEKLGEKEVIGKEEYEGRVFYGSGITAISLPSTLKKIEAETFRNCRNLKRVDIPNGTEYIGAGCFWGSGIEEISLPSTLRKIEDTSFVCRSNIRTIWVEDGFALALGAFVSTHVKILSRYTRVSD